MTAMIWWIPKVFDVAPDLESVVVDENRVPIIAWRIVGTLAKPVFVQLWRENYVSLIDMPGGQLYCPETHSTYRDIEHAKQGLLNHARSEWNLHRLKQQGP
jgi:hypothetical protein